ncbi:hypothetical protein OIU76_012001, partial [Salix suchowensis]
MWIKRSSVYQYLDVPRNSEEINAVILPELLPCSPFSSVRLSERSCHILDLNVVCYYFCKRAYLPKNSPKTVKSRYRLIIRRIKRPRLNKIIPRRDFY